MNINVKSAVYTRIKGEESIEIPFNFYTNLRAIDKLRFVNNMTNIIVDDNTPVFVSVDENDKVEGYVFCILEQKLNDNLFTDIKTLYIDDLCIDENIRGKHIGTDLYNFVLNYAKSIGCYNITLNVWSCNKSALGFYEHLGLIPQKIYMEKIL